MYGFMKIQTSDGFKRIDCIDRGDMILTNDGYQPVALIDICRYPHKLINNNIIESPIIKIAKHFFAFNMPNNDTYLSCSMPFSLGLDVKKEDTDYMYKHLFVKQLLELENIEREHLNSEYETYNIIFDKQYEINVNNLKVLSYHPNHENNMRKLDVGMEFNLNNRSKKIYINNENIPQFRYFKLNELLNKNKNITTNIFLAKLLQFNHKVVNTVDVNNNNLVNDINDLDIS